MTIRTPLDLFRFDPYAQATLRAWLRAARHDLPAARARCADYLARGILDARECHFIRVREQERCRIAREECLAYYRKAQTLVREG